MPSLIHIDGANYAVAHDDLLPKGRSLLTRRKRATNGTDPGRIRTAVWNLTGPVGHSRESNDRPLSVDVVQNLETRFTDLLTSSGKQNAVTRSSADPKASGSGKFGEFKFGASGTKFGGAVSGSNVKFFAEQQGYLLAFAGRIVTQIRISDWTVIASHTFDAQVRGVGSWFGKVRVGLGGTKALQTLTGLSSTGMTWSDEQVSGSDVLAKAVEVGSDRLWLVRASSDGTNDNEVRYTLDDFSSISNSFVVGDPKAGATGLGAFGPYMSVGSEVGLFSFTDQGKPVPLSRALVGTRSAENGRQFADPGFGFQYAITVRGLRSLVPGQFDQPVGVGSPFMRDFEGHDGRPTAIYPFGDEMLVAYRTSGGDAYLYRCVPGPLTGGTGHPDHFPLAYAAATEVDAFFGTATPTNPTLGWGTGTEFVYVTQGRTGADIYDANYRFSTGGGVWFGTTMTRSGHLKKTLRLARFATENMTAGDTWQLACSFDGGSYVDVDSARTTTGYHTVRPVSGGVPRDDITGHTIKPRLTQVAAGADSETSPPQIRGTLEIEYDERPDEIVELDVPIHLGGSGANPDTELAALEALSSSSQEGPVAIRLPESRTVVRYGMVSAVEVQDVAGNGVRVAVLRIQLWSVN